MPALPAPLVAACSMPQVTRASASTRAQGGWPASRQQISCYRSLPGESGTGKDLVEGSRRVHDLRFARGDTRAIGAARTSIMDMATGNLGPKLGPITPKHRGTTASTRYQKTRPANNIDNRAESAKPPSPVQIRAAPPILSKLFVRARGSQLQALENAREWTYRRLTADERKLLSDQRQRRSFAEGPSRQHP